MDLSEIFVLKAEKSEESDGDMIKRRALLAACDDFLSMVGLDPGPNRIKACEALRDFVYIAMDHEEEEEDY